MIFEPQTPQAGWFADIGWNEFIIPRSPHTRLLAVIFGGPNLAVSSELSIMAGFADKPAFLLSRPDGLPLDRAFLYALGRLSVRQNQIIDQRFGLTSGKGQTLKAVATENGCTPENIRAMESKALRKLRHPYRSVFIRDCLYQYTYEDYRASLAREELCDILSGIYKESLAYQLTMRTTRRYLAQALGAAKTEDMQRLNLAVAYSCKLTAKLESCPLCDDPVPPGMVWCLAHLNLQGQRRGQGSVVLVCDGCGIRFPRKVSVILGTTRRLGRTTHLVFCGNACRGENAGRLGLLTLQSHGGYRKDRVPAGQPELECVE